MFVSLSTYASIYLSTHITSASRVYPEDSQVSAVSGIQALSMQMKASESRWTARMDTIVGELQELRSHVGDLDERLGELRGEFTRSDEQTDIKMAKLFNDLVVEM